MEPTRKHDPIHAIHAWFHRWLPRLNNRLDVIFILLSARRWHSLFFLLGSYQINRHSVLMPWVSVFSGDPGSMDPFLIKNILPKLQNALMSITIDLMHQQMHVGHRLEGPYAYIEHGGTTK